MRTGLRRREGVVSKGAQRGGFRIAGKGNCGASDTDHISDLSQRGDRANKGGRTSTAHATYIQITSNYRYCTLRSCSTMIDTPISTQLVLFLCHCCNPPCLTSTVTAKPLRRYKATSKRWAQSAATKTPSGDALPNGQILGEESSAAADCRGRNSRHEPRSFALRFLGCCKQRDARMPTATLLPTMPPARRRSFFFSGCRPPNVPSADGLAAEH